VNWRAGHNLLFAQPPSRTWSETGEAGLISACISACSSNPGLGRWGIPVKPDPTRKGDQMTVIFSAAIGRLSFAVAVIL
jgi:hypothetical protein